MPLPRKPKTSSKTKRPAPKRKLFSVGLHTIENPFSYSRVLKRTSGKPLTERVSFTVDGISGLNGFIQVRNKNWKRLIGELVFVTSPVSRELRVHSIEVIRPYRGQGLNQQMLAEVIDLARKRTRLKRVALEVYENNTEAIKSYKTFGFKDAGEFCPANGSEPAKRRMVYEL